MDKDVFAQAIGFADILDASQALIDVIETPHATQRDIINFKDKLKRAIADNGFGPQG